MLQWLSTFLRWVRTDSESDNAASSHVAVAGRSGSGSGGGGGDGGSAARNGPSVHVPRAPRTVLRDTTIHTVAYEITWMSIVCGIVSASGQVSRTRLQEACKHDG